MKTYGEIAHQDGLWLVEAEPHVVLRLKRLLPRLSRKAHGTLRITDTVETARELEWFTLRYPMTFRTPAAEARLQERASAHREQETVVAKLLAGTTPPRDFRLALPPREYQSVAASLALEMGGLLVADDLGLGKTCTAICMLSDPRTRPALIVTLTHLPRQWAAELQKFAPKLRVHILKKGTPYDLTRPKGARRGQQMLTQEMPDVIISNYHKLAGWADTLAPILHSVVFDEVQELRRGEESNKGAAAFHIAENVEFRMGLSATPIYNFGGEIFNVLSAIRPHALGTYSEFAEEWCAVSYGDKAPRIKDPKAFGTYLRDTGLMLRRTRAEVGRELPEVTRIPHHIDCDTSYLDTIETAAEELAAVILSHNPTARGEKLRAAEELSALVRQATGVAKAPFVAEFVRMLVESGESVVLYGWHREVYSLWLERLRAFAPAMYTGSETPTQKEEAKRRFLSGETPVLIMSLRSGAGLDGLQERCRTVVFGELDWSPGVHEQCIGRVHRDGQGDPVAAYFLIADEGSDPIVADVLGVKQGQIEGIRDPHGGLIERLDVSGDRVRRLAQSYVNKARVRPRAEPRGEAHAQ